MYSKNEAAVLSGEFWTVFGRYMSPVLSAENEKINWINYRTGIKGIQFLMSAGGTGAKVSINFSHKDAVIQLEQYEKFIMLKNVMRQRVGEDWVWQAPGIIDEGTTASGIYASLAGISIYEKADWPAIISFLKSRIMLLDKFWCEHKYAFDKGSF